MTMLIPSKRLCRRLLLILLFALSVPGCGKRGPLVYPDLMVAAAPSTVDLHQFGQGMLLSFQLPGKDLAGQRLADLGGVKILKREMISGEAPECMGCTSDFRLYKVIYLDVLDNSYRRYGSRILLLDGDARIGRSYAYVVIPFTKEKQDGEASKPVLATFEPPPPPPELKTFSSPTEIKLELKHQPISGAEFSGYNIYRALKGEQQPYVPLNKQPIKENVFVDSAVELRKTYHYTARIVVRTRSGEVVESGPSGEQEGGLTEEE